MLLSQDAMKALKAYNTEALNRFHKRKVHNTDVVEEPQDDPPEPSVPDTAFFELPESDPDIPEDLFLIVNVTALRIWTRLFRPTRHTRYHLPRIPHHLLRGSLITTLPTM